MIMLITDLFEVQKNVTQAKCTYHNTDVGKNKGHACYCTQKITISGTRLNCIISIFLFDSDHSDHVLNQFVFLFHCLFAVHP